MHFLYRVYSLDQIYDYVTIYRILSRLSYLHVAKTIDLTLQSYRYFKYISIYCLYSSCNLYSKYKISHLNITILHCYVTRFRKRNLLTLLPLYFCVFRINLWNNYFYCLWLREKIVKNEMFYLFLPILYLLRIIFFYLILSNRYYLCFETLTTIVLDIFSLGLR